MKGKIGFGLFIEIVTLIVIIAISRSQGVSKKEYWDNFEIRTETLDLQYYVVSYASFKVNGTEVKDWLTAASTSPSIKDDIEDMLDSLTVSTIRGEAFYKGAQDSIIAHSPNMDLKELTRLFQPTVLFEDTIKTYRKDFPVRITRYYPDDHFQINLLLKARDKNLYFSTNWVDHFSEENLVTIEDLSGFEDLTRLLHLVDRTLSFLEKHGNELELTWRKGAETIFDGKNHLGGGISIYRINDHEGDELYYADYLFEGLEWKRDEYGEEELDERFNIWYQSWIFWLFVIPISFSIIRRFLVWNSIPD